MAAQWSEEQRAALPMESTKLADRYVAIGDVRLPLLDFAVARTGILGITRSGKTYAAKGLAEQLLTADIPVVVFDAIGVWRFLKTPGTEPGGKGFPIVIAGGAAADLPLTKDSAPEIVRAAIRENIPLVIDLYDPKLSKADWRSIVQHCFRTLLYENKGVRHIFLEEAAEYAPQKIIDGATYAEIEKLARMGGNVGLGLTIINQRAQEVNKAVLELCDNLVLLRQRGSHAIGNLEKWLDRVSPETARAISKELPHMTQGECWVWAEANEHPVRTKTAALRSFHADRRAASQAAPACGAVDTHVFVSRLSGELGALVEQAKANDPAEMRKRIKELETQLAKVEKAAPAAKTERVEVPVLNGDALKRVERLIERGEGFSKRWQELHDKLRDQQEGFVIGLRSEMRELTGAVGRATTRAALPPRQPLPFPKPTASEKRGGQPLPVGERSTLIACAQHEGCGRDQLSILTGYKRSTRDAYIQRLRERGFVELAGDRVVATQAGVDALGSDFEPLPTGDALRAYWFGRLPAGERKVLEMLSAHFPAGVERSLIGDVTGFQRSTRDAYIQRLKARRLVTSLGLGGVRASAELFG